VPDAMSAADLATLSLLDPDQGVCPSGHACRLDDHVGNRRCATCDFRGLALICWEITPTEIDRAKFHGADATVVRWAKLFLADKARA
jgi:hypothetical protein